MEQQVSPPSDSEPPTEEPRRGRLKTWWNNLSIPAKLVLFLFPLAVLFMKDFTWKSRTGVLGSWFILILLVGVMPDGDAVTIDGWQNPTAMTVVFSVTTYDPNNGDALTDYIDRTEWRVGPHETVNLGSGDKRVECSGDSVAVMLMAWNANNDAYSGVGWGNVKCNNGGHCGMVVDLDLKPRLSGCQE